MEKTRNLTKLTVVECLSLFLLANFIVAQTCDDLQCPICCRQTTSGTFECSDDALTCRLKGTQDFSSLIFITVAILGIFIGIPLVFKIFEVMVLYRIEPVGLSFCELMVKIFCTCDCFKRKPKNRVANSSNQLPMVKTIDPGPYITVSNAKNG